VVCVDEKTAIGARSRKHPGRRAAPGRVARREFEYIRHGFARGLQPAPPPPRTMDFLVKG
jgi:hypothetical protein